MPAGPSLQNTINNLSPNRTQHMSRSERDMMELLKNLKEITTYIKRHKNKNIFGGGRGGGKDKNKRAYRRRSFGEKASNYFFHTTIEKAFQDVAKRIVAMVLDIPKAILKAIPRVLSRVSVAGYNFTKNAAKLLLRATGNLLPEQTSPVDPNNPQQNASGLNPNDPNAVAPSNSTGGKRLKRRLFGTPDPSSSSVGSVFNSDILAPILATSISAGLMQAKLDMMYDLMQKQSKGFENLGKSVDNVGKDVKKIKTATSGNSVSGTEFIYDKISNALGSLLSFFRNDKDPIKEEEKRQEETRAKRHANAMKQNRGPGGQFASGKKEEESGFLSSILSSAKSLGSFLSGGFFDFLGMIKLAIPLIVPLIPGIITAIGLSAMAGFIVKEIMSEGFDKWSTQFVEGFDEAMDSIVEIFREKTKSIFDYIGLGRQDKITPEQANVSKLSQTAVENVQSQVDSGEKPQKALDITQSVANIVKYSTDKEQAQADNGSFIRNLTSPENIGLAASWATSMPGMFGPFMALAGYNNDQIQKNTKDITTANNGIGTEQENIRKAQSNLSISDSPSRASKIATMSTLKQSTREKSNISVVAPQNTTVNNVPISQMRSVVGGARNIDSDLIQRGRKRGGEY